MVEENFDFELVFSSIPSVVIVLVLPVVVQLYHEALLEIDTS